jgi:outer membrane protein TolC
MKHFHPIIFLPAGTLVLLLAGCVAASPAERDAGSRVQAVGSLLRIDGHPPALPELRPDSPLADYVRFGVLSHPQVLAAYHDWRAAVSAIAPARVLPDPQFTFEADIADTLMTFMPGLMFDFMAPGKRRAMARELTASSDVSYRTYAATVLRTASEVRKAWIELAFVGEAIRLREGSTNALQQSLELANTDYTTGRGMGTLSNQVRFTNDLGKVRTELAMLADRRTALRTRFKSALGLAPADRDPAWPQTRLTPTALPGEDELWRHVAAANPGLGQMRAMVEMAVAGIEIARRARTPDFALGAMADLKANPLMVRPTASVTLPVWREKIAAGIAAAEARRDANVARVTAEQLNLAAEFAQMLFMVREADRMIAYLDELALPNLDRVLATSEAGYQSGMTSPAMIPETELMVLDLRLERAVALREREIAVTELLLMAADVAPGSAPLLAENISQR